MANPPKSTTLRAHSSGLCYTFRMQLLFLCKRGEGQTSHEVFDVDG